MLRRSSLLSAAAILWLMVLTPVASAHTVTASSCNGQDATIIQVDGQTVINGTNGDDVIVAGIHDESVTVYGLGGNDLICTGGGDDIVDGGGGDDDIFTGAGDDWATGGPGNDVIGGDLGNDILKGAGKNDVLNGGSGDDILIGGGGDDELNGGLGNDTLRGKTGNDDLYGGEGNDVLVGNQDADYLSGGAGDDTLRGGAGNDDLRSGDGDDVAMSGGGADKVRGGDGFDVLRGGRGTDQVWGESGETVVGGAGYDACDPLGEARRCETYNHVYSLTPAQMEAEWGALVEEHFGPLGEAENAMVIIKCESGGNPFAANGRGHRGLFQHYIGYWPDRAERAGLPGASIFNPEANIIVSAWLVEQSIGVHPAGPWGHWTCRHQL